MDGSPEFRLFLERWIADAQSANWIVALPSLPYSSLDSDISSSERVSDGGEEDTSEQESTPGFSNIEQVLNRVEEESGTAWIPRRRSSAQQVLLDAANHDEVRQQALAIISNTSDYSTELGDNLTPGVTPDLLFAELLTLLQGPQLGAIITRLNALLIWYDNAIAISVIIRAERLPRRAPEHALLREIRRSIRRGRNRLSAAVRELVQNTQFFEHTHQRIVEQQLTRLTTMRAEWQQAQFIAGMASTAPPTPAELASFRRLEELIRRRPDLNSAIDVLDAERQSLRRINRSSDETQDHRREARLRLRTIWPELTERRQERQTVNQEIGQLRRDLNRQTRERIQQYLEAQRRGIRREEARQDRDVMLARLDRQLSGVTSHRLQVDEEEGRWTRYEMLLERLLSNSLGIAIELFMDSFLKVAQYVERRREIGLDSHHSGRVQWLTYPGHGDNAVDWNCQSGLQLTASMPDEFTIPDRFQFAQQDRQTLQLVSSFVTARVAGSNDLQDIFGKIAYGLLGRSGSRSESLSRLLREHDGQEIAPPEILTRHFQGGEISRLLTGLAARNLTPIDNAAGFNHLRSRILRDIEQEVGRREGRAGTSVIYFDRSRLHASSGAFGLGRFVVSIRVADLLRHVAAMMSSNESSSFSHERTTLINRIWQLLLLMRSAGAEPHRRAASATVRHIYGTGSDNQLTVEVYYTHMHRLSVRPGSILSRGDQIGLTGSTGNAVNSHVHIEIRLLRATRELGTCLPHEFFETA